MCYLKQYVDEKQMLYQNAKPSSVVYTGCYSIE